MSTRTVQIIEAWIYGLAAAFIGGAATAITADQALSMAHRMGMDVPVLNFKAMGIVALAAGIYSAAMYLKQSPLPKFKIAEDAPANLPKVVPLLLAALASALVLSACATSQNRAAYQAAGAVKISAEAAMEGWAAWCKAGKADADEIRTVEKAYRAYAAAQNLAVDAGKATVGTSDAGKLQTMLKVAAACEADVVALVLKFLPADVAEQIKQ
ncbi:MAG: hypothetical protein HZC54_00700 [Verrucomicrobia bacterium]|nr:hypothetical protein [Verrucomicrobiota bacterium]